MSSDSNSNHSNSVGNNDFVETDEWLSQNVFAHLRDANDMRDVVEVVPVESVESNTDADDAFNASDILLDLNEPKLEDMPMVVDLVPAGLKQIETDEQIMHVSAPTAVVAAPAPSNATNTNVDDWAEKLQEMQLLEMLECKGRNSRINVDTIVKESIPSFEVIFNNTNNKPILISKGSKSSKKQIIKCANCNCIFAPFYFKKHVCDFDENHQLITQLQVTLPPAVQTPAPELISKRLKRENQIRIRRFFKEELKYDLSTFGASILLSAFNTKPSVSGEKSNQPTAAEASGSSTAQGKSKDGPHECSLCERKFVHASGLLRHMEKHALDLIPSPNTVNSSKIANSTQSSTQATNGLRIVLKCMVCGRIFFDPSSFVTHLNTHFTPDGKDGEPDIYATENDIYDLRFDEVQEMIANVQGINHDYNNVSEIQFEDFANICFKIVILSNVLQCEFCDMVFSDVLYLFYHTASHAAERTFECFGCEIQTQTCKEIVTHWQAECVFMRESLKVNNSVALRYFVCNVCEDKFGALELLIEHRYFAHHIMPRHSTKSKNLMLPCEYCEAVHDSADGAFTHFIEKHSKKLRREKDVAYANSSKTRLYLCDICGKSYTQSSHLWQHLRFHQGVKPFACKIPGCNRRFTIRPDLNDHIRKCHTGERPYHCIVCGKRFLTGSVFYQHRLIHRGERRYECEECGKRFYRADALKNHLRIHTGEKPFGCLFCTKHFRQRGDRDKHIRARHSHLDANTRLMMQMQKMQLERAAVTNPNSNAVANQALGVDVAKRIGTGGANTKSAEDSDIFFLGNLPVPKM